MARKLRIEYPGALCHVINRGNYRRDLFENIGTARSFEEAVLEVCHKFRQLRKDGVPYKWIAEALQMGKASSVRAYVHSGQS